MPLLDINFSWPVDEDGYRVETRTPPKRAKGERGSHLLSQSRTILIRNGGRLRWQQPVMLQSGLFMEFAHLPRDEGSILCFANSYGYLGSFIDDKAEDRVGQEGESLILWHDAIDTMRKLVKISQQNPMALCGSPGSEHISRIAKLDAVLLPNPATARPALRIHARSLIGAMYVQFAEAVSDGLDIHTCDHCGKWFTAGKGARRRVARFHSDECRDRFHNEQKRRAKS